jgi:hypothetical protein
LVVIRSAGEPGVIKVTAMSKGLTAADVIVNADRWEEKR